MNDELARLGDIVEIEREMTNPATLGGCSVDLFSIPAFDAGGVPEHTRADEIKSNKYLLRRPTLLVSKINPHISRTWLVSPGDLPALASTEFIPLVPTHDWVDLEYLNAVCSSKPFRVRLESLVTGTSTSHQRVKPRDLMDISIPIRTESDRARIGRLYSCILRGRSTERVKARVVDLMVASAFRRMFGSGAGEVPLADVANTTMGVSYRSADLGGESQALVTLKCFGRSGEYQEEGLKPWAGEPKVQQIVNEGDVVVAHTDLTQAADVLGRAILVRSSPRYAQLVASLDVGVVRSNSAVTREYLYGLLSQPEARLYVKSRANGTTVLHLSRRALPEYRIAVPSPAELTSYTAMVGPLLDSMLLSSKKMKMLADIQSRFIETEFPG